MIPLNVLQNNNLFFIPENITDRDHFALSTTTKFLF